MEPEQRGRASRASSTSSLGREVRCGCQYYQSDSLLPERRALLGRPPSRTMQQPPAVRCSEHEYEPIAAPSPSPKPPTAPVVRITDTDIVPVADSDDSIDDRGRLPPELTRDGDVVLPLDGKIEDTAMEGRELVETGDTSEEQETPQQLQERLEERFLSAATPGAESRTDGEVNTSQVDSLALEELPLRRGARGFPQRLKTQAGKLRSRLRNIQRPTFSFPERQKPEKSKSTSSGRSDRSKSEKRPSRMDRIRSSFSERPRFSLPNRPKFNLPDRSKFHLPERPKFNLPERAKFHLPERPKFNIKKPNIRLPDALTRTKKPPSDQEQVERSTNSTVGSRRNIFDFSTYPRIFDKKSKKRCEYATSTPKDSRAQSAESATFPRARKGLSEKWAQRFEDTAYIDEDRPDAVTTVERSRPWRHPSAEEPRLSIGMEGEEVATIPWEEKRQFDQEEELQFMDYDQESPEVSDRQPHPRSVDASRTEDESYDRERIDIDPRLYGDQGLTRGYPRVPKDQAEDRRAQETWQTEEEMIMAQNKFRSIARSRSMGDEGLQETEEERFEGTFAAVDPRRRYGPAKLPSEEEEYEEDMEDEEEEEQEPSSAQSDREQQQSSGSSCDRRRRGVIEEIDSDEFFLREGGLSNDDMRLGKYLTNEIRDALREDIVNALADDTMVIPPQRPVRTRSLRKRKEGSVDSYDVMPPARPKRDQTRARRSESADDFRERTRSDSRHRVVYQAEGSPRELTPAEPLDDIVVVKPIRRKSRSSQRSQSQVPMDVDPPPSSMPATPPVVPTRRKRLHRITAMERRNGDVGPICNGHTEWADLGVESAPEKPLPLPPTMSEELPNYREALTAEELRASNEENVRKLATRLRDEDYVEPVPIPPKRRSRSRGTSIAQDEDRTSHGAESLPEAGYVEDDIPSDDVDFGRDLSGYAIIDKREKPPRPPPPRRRKEKFATTPRPVAPKRPQRAYSTLGPGKSRETSILSETITFEPTEIVPYVEIDSDEGEHKDLRSGEVLSKMQRRPLPAPPRPPRVRKERSLDRADRSIEEFATETTTATQTDPLPDDMIIEEEITQAKLVVAPSRSGSQIMVSMERIPSPLSMPTPTVPPLPVSQRLHRDEQAEVAYDTVSLKSPSPVRDEAVEERHLSAPHLEEPHRVDGTHHVRSVRSALLSDETVRIGNLEVGDLRVDRLSVSQIEADKIVASEVDALLVTASELKNMGSSLEESLSPSIISELIAIRSHLEAVAASRAQEQSRLERSRMIEAEKKSDIPVTETRRIEEKPKDEEEMSNLQDSAEDEKSKSKEDQKVVKSEVTEVRDRLIPVTHTLSVAQIEIKDSEIPKTHTLSVAHVEHKDKEIATTHTPTIVQDIEDKSLRILDSESPLSLSTGTAMEPKLEEPREFLPPSVKTASETTESRLSPERASEPTSKQSEIQDSIIPPEFSAMSTYERADREGSSDSTERKTRKSRSRSSSPNRGISPVRQTASPVRSLPPAISVTPDTPDVPTVQGVSNEIQPQRAVISYSSCTERSDGESQRESSQSPVPSFPLGGTHFIAFPASQVPAQFFSLTDQTSREVESDPSIAQTTKQLLRALRVAGLQAMRYFIGYLSSMVNGEESREKIREVELTICALLLLIAGLLIFFFSSTRTVTHHHHWDYFNPPQ